MAHEIFGREKLMMLIPTIDCTPSTPYYVHTENMVAHGFLRNSFMARVRSRMSNENEPPTSHHAHPLPHPAASEFS